MLSVKMKFAGRACVWAWVGASLWLASSCWAQSAEPASARVIVKLRASSPLMQNTSPRKQIASATAAASQRMQRLGARLGLALSDGQMLAERTQVALARGMRAQDLAQQLARQQDVEYAVVDQRRQPYGPPPNDPLYAEGQSDPYPPSGQWYLRAPTATTVSAVDGPAAWNITPGSSAVVVAVLDTGVRFDHEDLAGKLLNGYNMVSEAVRAGNTSGRGSDASDRGDALSGTEIAQRPDLYAGCEVQSSSSWHGTRVAGVIGAHTHNSLGMAGLGGDVRILPVRVMGKCGGYDSDIIAGMRWAAGLPVDGVPDNLNPAQVLNLSLGDSGSCSPAYIDAIEAIHAQGAVIVVSAGNSAGQAVASPANCPGVIAVAGLRHVGSKVGYSSVGPQVALSAPGGNCVNLGDNEPCLYPILSTSNAGSSLPLAAPSGSIYTGAYENASYGTSFAAPLASATAALMLSVRPQIPPAGLKQLMMRTTRAFPSSGGSPGTLACAAPSNALQLECYCTTLTCGAGMLDAGAAVTAADTQAVPQITVSTAVVQPGQTVVLSGAGSLPSPGAGSSISYQWSLEDGGGIVSHLTPGVQAETVSVMPSGYGRFAVRLTIDDGQQTASTVLAIDVSLPAPPTGTGGSPSSGGGGGTLPWWASAVLVAAAGALHWRRRSN